MKAWIAIPAVTLLLGVSACNRLGKAIIMCPL